jgi:hypothetical protein
MKKRITVELPDYFSITHYKALNSFEHLDELEKVIHAIAATTEHSVESIKEWNITDLLGVYKGIGELFDTISNEFYPVFEFKGVTYGFQPISKMLVAEFIDLDGRLKDPMKNLEELMAILYRPVVNQRFESFEWKVKSYIKTIVGQSENIFKYYDVEEYDSQKRDWRVEVFKDLPISYALGALTFFLQFGLMLQKDLVSSTPNIPMSQKKETMEMLEKAIQSVRTMGGYTPSGQLEKDLSSLQEKNQSLN